MKRPAQNFLLDVVIFAVLIGLIGTGIILKFTLPPGSGSSSVLALTRHEWGDVHFWLAAGMLILVGIHLVLHARWVGAMIRGRERARARTRVSLSVVAIVAAFLLLLLPFVLPVTHRADHARHGRTELVVPDQPSDETSHSAPQQRERRRGS